MVGTHTHVSTADEHLLPKGTAYITDVGMTGPHDGVIGMDRVGVLKRFLDGLPARFEVATGDVQMNAVLIETDDEAPRNEAGRAERKIDRTPAPPHRLTCFVGAPFRLPPIGGGGPLSPA